MQLPAIGSVPAQGLTMSELKAEIEHRYTEFVHGIEVTPILVTERRKPKPHRPGHARPLTIKAKLIFLRTTHPHWLTVGAGVFLSSPAFGWRIIRPMRQLSHAMSVPVRQIEPNRLDIGIINSSFGFGPGRARLRF